jgi:hypothetical protein
VQAGQTNRYEVSSSGYEHYPDPVIGRLSNGTLLLDLRCLELADEHQFLEQIVELRP